MKIILLKDIAKMGKRGEVKEVADGYAINVLIKKQDAIQATPQELLKWKQKQDAQQHKKDLATNTFTQLIAILRTKEISISSKKTDTKGQLFAQIKETDIVEAIFAVTSLSVDPKQITILTPIKSVGIHSVELKQDTQKEILKIVVK